MDFEHLYLLTQASSCITDSLSHNIMCVETNKLRISISNVHGHHTSAVLGGGCLVRGGWYPNALRQTPNPPHPGETATSADGTLPTGMHSCLP